jgi:hypothetical protein
MKSRAALMLSPLPLVGEGGPKGRERVLLSAQKSPLPPLCGTLSHKWERGQRGTRA